MAENIIETPQRQWPRGDVKTIEAHKRNLRLTPFLREQLENGLAGCGIHKTITGGRT